MAKLEKQRTIKDWIIATRPWSLTAAAIPVLVTTAYVWWKGRLEGAELNWTNAVFSFFLLVMLQIVGNLIGDYYDHTNGVDKPDCPNGVTWIHSGLFAPKEILYYGYAFFTASAAVGLIILFNSSFQGLWLGVAGLLMVACYPWLKAHALGDVDVLFGFALLPALGVGFVTTGQWLWQTVLLSLTYGPITVAILHANNTRDIANDSGAGLTTLCIAIGTDVSKLLYYIELVVPYILVLVCYLLQILPLWSFITFVTLPVAIGNCRLMHTAEQAEHLPSGGYIPQIATLDQQTAKLQLMFGLLLTLSFVIAEIL